MSEFLRKKSIHPKINNIEYTELKTQKYLSSGLVSANQGEILLKFRSRIANYINNFGSSESACKLCQNHPDSQEYIYTCEFNQNNVEVRGEYEDIFKNEIKIERIRVLENIYKTRMKRFS